MLGDIDVLLDDQSRPTSIEFYGNPARWKKVTTDVGGTMDVFDMSLELDYDTNGIASVDVSVSMEHDSPGATLTVRFGEELERWFVFAEGLSIGISKGQRLAAFRFHPFDVEG
jgi:hypothetical protein